MEVGGPLPLLHSLWDRLFQLATRREVVISSLVGICGLGLFWGTRRLVALNHFETQLLKQHGTHRSSSKNLNALGESTYIQNLSSFMDIDPYRVRVFYAPHSLVSILPKPIPLIVSHGWPSTFWDIHRAIRPLTDPAACGPGPAISDGYVIVNSGYGYAMHQPGNALLVYAVDGK